MMSLAQVAADVVTLLSAGTFSKTIAPSVEYDTTVLLESLGTMSVVVVPASLSQSPDSRISLELVAAVDVAIRYKFGTTDVDSDGSITITKIKGYLDLLEELAEYLANPSKRRLANGGHWSGNDIRYPWVPEHIRNERQYTGIFRASYVLQKAY